jgi:hypothetical protein
MYVFIRFESSFRYFCMYIPIYFIQNQRDSISQPRCYYAETIPTYLPLSHAGKSNTKDHLSF